MNTGLETCVGQSHPSSMQLRPVEIMSGESLITYGLQTSFKGSDQSGISRSAHA